jgi:hypothetical protein
MDFHAHLMATSVVGFLAGEWDKETKRKERLLKRASRNNIL